MNCLPSTWLTTNLVPHNASCRVISFCITKSQPWRLNTGWSTSCTHGTRRGNCHQRQHEGQGSSRQTSRVTWMANTMSPASMPGASSDMPANTILSPAFIPFSMCTSNTFRSSTVFLPLHVLHWSCGLTIFPWPLQAVQGDCICWIIGPR
jgi:hypothetical protein